MEPKWLISCLFGTKITDFLSIWNQNYWFLVYLEPKYYWFPVNLGSKLLISRLFGTKIIDFVSGWNQNYWFRICLEPQLLFSYLDGTKMIYFISGWNQNYLFRIWFYGQFQIWNWIRTGTYGKNFQRSESTALFTIFFSINSTPGWQSHIIIMYCIWWDQIRPFSLSHTTPDPTGSRSATLTFSAN